MKKLILDLDQTLIASNVVNDENNADFCINAETKNYWIYRRPYLNEFLKIMMQHFDLYIYTAADKQYSDCIINNLESSVGKKIFKYRYSREHCEYKSVKYVNFYKDIEKLGFSTNDTIILDDNPAIYREQFNNVIKIKEWYCDDKTDNELYKLVPILLSLKKVNDIKFLIQEYNRITYPNIYNYEFLTKNFCLKPEQFLLEHGMMFRLGIYREYKVGTDWKLKKYEEYNDKRGWKYENIKEYVHGSWKGQKRFQSMSILAKFVGEVLPRISTNERNFKIKPLLNREDIYINQNESLILSKALSIAWKSMKKKHKDCGPDFVALLSLDGIKYLAYELGYMDIGLFLAEQLLQSIFNTENRSDNRIIPEIFIKSLDKININMLSDYVNKNKEFLYYIHKWLLKMSY